MAQSSPVGAPAPVSLSTLTLQAQDAALAAANSVQALGALARLMDGYEHEGEHLGHLPRGQLAALAMAVYDVALAAMTDVTEAIGQVHSAARRDNCGRAAL